MLPERAVSPPNILHVLNFKFSIATQMYIALNKQTNNHKDLLFLILHFLYATTNRTILKTM